MAMRPSEAEQFDLTGGVVTDSFVFHATPGMALVAKRLPLEQAVVLSVPYDPNTFNGVPLLRGRPEDTRYALKADRVEGMDVKILTPAQAAADYNGCRSRDVSHGGVVIPLPR